MYDYIFQKKRTDGVICAILMALYTALLEMVQVHHTVSFGSINAKQRRHWLYSVWSQPQLFWPQPKLFLVTNASHGVLKPSTDIISKTNLVGWINLQKISTDPGQVDLLLLPKRNQQQILV